jgi:glycosyltransferase involved in cell wall biosynthesis
LCISRGSGDNRMSSEKATVCLCTYNGGLYLKELLDSLARQTHLPSALLVGDDGSSDDTLQIVREFAANASFPVKVLSNSRRLGPAGNLELLLSEATGSVLFPCDQDDVWEPTKIEVLAKALTDSPGFDGAICNSSLIDARGRVLPGSLFEKVGLDMSIRQLMESGNAMVQIAGRNVVASHALALRRRALDIVLPFGPLRHADWWIALVLGATTGITVVDDCLVAYRLHDTNAAGLREDLRVAERASAATAARFSSHADMLEAAIARVDLVRAGRLAPRDRAVLEERVSHLRTRESLPPKRSRRVSTVLREVIKGRYAEFGNGWRSVLVDLVREAPATDHEFE